MDTILEDMRAFIDLRIREGFESVHEIIEGASNYALETLGHSNLRTEINRIVADSLVKYRAEQGTWESITDCCSPMGALKKKKQTLQELPTGLLPNFDGLDWMQNGKGLLTTQSLLKVSCGRNDARISGKANP